MPVQMQKQVSLVYFHAAQSAVLISASVFLLKPREQWLDQQLKLQIGPSKHFSEKH